MEEGFAFRSFECYNKKNWYAYVDLKKQIGPVTFDKVRHLEELFWRSTVTIEDRVGQV